LANPADGAAQFQEAVRINPANADVYRIWGEALASSGNTDEAIAKYRKALELNPTLVIASVLLKDALKNRRPSP